LNRLECLQSVAHGGQVLVSSVTADLASEELPAGVSLQPLGEHRLRDLARPERVFQLAAEGLPSSFPPLQTDQSIDAHFGVVARAVTEGRVVLFLGEQMNLCGRRPGVGWHPGNAQSLPTGEELAAHLAKSFAYPDPAVAELARVAEYVSVVAGPRSLREALHSFLDLDYRPNVVHEFIASLPGLLREQAESARYPLVVTTNYDDALERAFAAVGEPFDLVVYIAEGDGRGRFWHVAPDGRRMQIDRPNKYADLPMTERAVILKIHGAVDRANADGDSFVVTEDDYLDYLSRADVSNLLPVSIAARLRKSHYLFLGYSLRDWNTRVILHRLWGEQRLAYKSWAAELTPDVLEQELWRKRDVDILSIRLDEYVEELADRFLLMPREDATELP
jgi:hypothetical protein